MEKIKAFFREEDGQGMVEYGLIIALVAVIALVAFRTLGQNADEQLTKAATALKDPSSVTE